MKSLVTVLIFFINFVAPSLSQASGCEEILSFQFHDSDSGEGISNSHRRLIVQVNNNSFYLSPDENSALEKDWSSIIAEEPYDQMGKEFSFIFGDFIKRNQVHPDNMDDLALKIFGLRLELAQKYKTYFVHMMTQAGLKSSLPVWDSRWQGLSFGEAWSFGQENHWRGHQIWLKILDQFNGFSKSIEIIDTSDLQHFDLKIDQEIKTIEVAYLDYQNTRLSIRFKIYHLEPGLFYIRHASDQEVLIARNELRFLWRQSLDERRPISDRVNSLAQFEWLWFWTNPFGRAGALTGDALSLLIQKQMLSEGHSIRIRSRYEMLDLEAFSSELRTYIAKRMSLLL